MIAMADKHEFDVTVEEVEWVSGGVGMRASSIKVRLRFDAIPKWAIVALFGVSECGVMAQPTTEIEQLWLTVTTSAPWAYKIAPGCRYTADIPPSWPVGTRFDVSKLFTQHLLAAPPQ